MKHIVNSILFFILSAVLSVPAFADAQQARDRMMSRLPQLDQLRLSGAIGENRDGFLEARADQPDIPALIAAENADRREVYQAIAAQQGASTEEVAKARARQIAEKAAPGIWIQSADGAWQKK